MNLATLAHKVQTTGRFLAVGIPVGAESNMAEYGEWNRKGATLSSVTAQKKYGVEIDFIEEGIRAGELEYRQGAVWGNPYLRVLRNQLERYISAQLGPEYIMEKKAKIELPSINKEIYDIRNRLTELEALKAAYELAIKKS